MVRFKEKLGNFIFSKKQSVRNPRVYYKGSCHFLLHKFKFYIVWKSINFPGVTPVLQLREGEKRVLLTPSEVFLTDKEVRGLPVP